MPDAIKKPSGKPASAKAGARVYQGKSADDRVSKRRQKLLDTAFQLLAEGGWRKITIDALCLQAELHKRYFYESFASLDDVVVAVVDSLSSELTVQAFTTARAARAQGLSTPEIAQQALETVICFITDDPRRARVLFSEVAESPRAIEHRKITVQVLSQALSAYGHEHHNASGTDPIAGVASALLVGGSIEVIMSWLNGSITMSREQLISDLSRLWVYAGDGAVEIGKARQP